MSLKHPHPDGLHTESVAVAGGWAVETYPAEQQGYWFRLVRSNLPAAGCPRRDTAERAARAAVATLTRAPSDIDAVDSGAFLVIALAKSAWSFLQIRTDNRTDATIDLDGSYQQVGEDHVRVTIGLTLPGYVAEVGDRRCLELADDFGSPSAIRHRRRQGQQHG